MQPIPVDAHVISMREAGMWATYWGCSGNTSTIPAGVRGPGKDYTATTYCSRMNRVGTSGSDNDLAWLHVHTRFIG